MSRPDGAGARSGRALSLLNIRYGTERYPEKVARRLRAVNIAAWLVAPVPAIFAVLRFLDPAPGMWRLGLVDAGFAFMFAAVPLFHRFGALAAPLFFAAVTYAFLFWVSILIGTDGGSFLAYLVASALVVLFYGPELTLLAATLAAIAAVLIVAVHLVAPDSTGLLSESSLFYGNFVINVAINTAVLFVIVHYAVRQIARAEATAEREFARSEALLANILPPSVAARLKAGREEVIADRFEAASILFADMAGFTMRAANLDPGELVRFLNRTFRRLDALVERHGLEKIKTTGDAFMVVSGVPRPRNDHAEALASIALDMRDELAGLTDPNGRAVPVRIGLASGPLVAGVVGTRKFFYDVWGDAVNLASRMESTGEPGRIQVTDDMRALLGDRFVFEERGSIEVKGKGAMRTWWLMGGRCRDDRTGSY
jgi:adenylate cyclase